MTYYCVWNLSSLALPTDATTLRELFFSDSSFKAFCLSLILLLLLVQKNAIPAVMWM